MVTLHRDLLMAHEECRGGGFYDIDYVGNAVLLSGKSFDYGPPRWSGVSVLLVPEAYRGMSIIYRDSRGDELNLTAEMTINYY
jgi:hypothetical protein